MLITLALLTSTYETFCTEYEIHYTVIVSEKYLNVIESNISIPDYSIKTETSRARKIYLHSTVIILLSNWVHCYIFAFSENGICNIITNSYT